MEGCFNYRDLNRLFFTTVAIIDYNEETGDVLLYNENFKAYRGQGEKQGTEVKVIFKGKGRTAYTAFAAILQSASYEIEYSQIKAIVITERAARHGIADFVDGLLRDQKPTLRAFLFVYNGDPEELLAIRLPDEQFLGLFLDNLMVSQGKIAHISQMRFDKYLNLRRQGSGVAVIPRLKIETVASEKRLSTEGAAVFVNDKMVDNLNIFEVFAYNFVINEAKVGVLYAEHPEVKNKYISLKLLNSNPKVSVNYDGETVHLVKNIKIKATVIETQEPLKLSNHDIVKLVEKDMEERIGRDCIKLFEKFKEKGIDLYNVKLGFDKKYPHEDVENVLDITDVVTNVDVFIEGSNDTRDFK